MRTATIYTYEDKKLNEMFRSQVPFLHTRDENVKLISSREVSLREVLRILAFNSSQMSEQLNDKYQEWIQAEAEEYDNMLQDAS